MVMCAACPSPLGDMIAGSSADDAQPDDTQNSRERDEGRELKVSPDRLNSTKEG